jgi:hypothetical protein
MMNKNRRSLDTQNPPSPCPDDNLRASAGEGRSLAGMLLSTLRALAGMLLTTLGLVTSIVGGVLAKEMIRALLGMHQHVGEGIPTARTLALLVAGFLTFGLGLSLLVAGMFLLGDRGKVRMVRFGCVLFFGGIASYLGNLIVNHGQSRLASGLGLLAAALGLLGIAAAKGWIGKGSIFDS